MSQRSAAVMRALLDGSVIRESHRTGDTRVQDPYCIRCQPQVTGAAMDVLRMAARTLEIEANAATDKWFYPRALTQVNTTGADIAGAYEAMPVHDLVNVKIDQANAGDSIQVWLLLDD